MKKLLVVLAALCFISVVLTPGCRNPLYRKYPGWYDTETGKIHCVEKINCLHEVVHKYDDDNGNISLSIEFRDAIKEYYEKVRNKELLTKLEYHICNFPGVGEVYGEDGWGGKEELYADIVSVSEKFGVDIPDEFKQFYDMEAIYELWNKYPNLQSAF